MDNNKENNEKNSRAKALITFLNLTKEGKFAPINTDSLAYTRIKEETDLTDYLDEEYYYSLS